ncbi:fumarylacetoacetate hydrolase family protein [Brucellaceae bacterium C25G]
MKLARFKKDGRISFGAIIDNGVIELKNRLGIEVNDIDPLIASQDLLSQAQIIIDEHKPDFLLNELELLRPIEHPEKCICVGVNYANRNAEYKDGSEAPRYPSLFIRYPESFVPHNSEIERPPESEQLDYEGEIVVIIGKKGRRIKQSEAYNHIMGYTIANEGSIRDFMRHGKFNVTPGKNFDRSGSLGPYIVTADEIGIEPLTITTWVNGEIRQSDTTENMIFSIPYLIEYISTVCTLNPGDIILTGTPNGSGARFDPPRFLRHGDVVEVEVSRIGRLKNVVKDEIV